MPRVSCWDGRAVAASINPSVKSGPCLEDWAWQLAADVYRLNLYSQLTKQWPPRNDTVTDEELAGAIRDSFTQVHEAAYREMVKLASDAALEVYDRVLSRTVKQSRVCVPN